MDTNIRKSRNKLFQELRPYCVRLSQLALKDDGSARNLLELTETTAHLLGILQQKCKENVVFDENLADYVLFPIMKVLALCQKRLGRLAELATSCLRIVIQHGRKTIDIKLGQQLLLLLTFFATGGSPAQSIPEELQVEVYGALEDLFRALGRTPNGPSSLVSVSTVPALGHCLSVLLDGATDGSSSQIQLEALRGVECLWLCVKDQQALSNFLPGTTSAMTKCLMPSTKAPRSRRVLVKALEVLQRVLISTLGDLRIRNIKDDDASGSTDGKAPILTKSWLAASAGQIKLALASVTKLRTHGHQDVRRALHKLCIVILDECHNSLADSAAILVETAMVLESSDPGEEDTQLQTSLKNLADTYDSITGLIKTTLYNWVTSLARVMQSSDESAKQSALQRLSIAQKILPNHGLDSDILNDALAESLKSSVIVLLQTPTNSKGVVELSAQDITDPKLFPRNETTMAQYFSPVFMAHESQKGTRKQLDHLIASLGSSQTQIKLASVMLSHMRHASGEEFLSAFWLSLRLVQAASTTDLAMVDLIDSDLISDDEESTATAELYGYAVSLLSDPREDIDWRAQAIGMEVVAYAAKESGIAFRPDLIDSLYPTVDLLGSANANLRQHAIVTLNILSKSCGYRSTSEMIIQNVDYLVNAVSLKLNTFDISPQAPQVLLMMIRLTGSPLLPYLEDISGSIFAALDNFHGYPRLVNSLFAVLGEIVDESTRSEKSRLTISADITHRKVKPVGPKIEDILTVLGKMESRARAREQEEQEHIAFPSQPWKSAETIFDDIEHRDHVEKGQEVATDTEEVNKTAPTKVYLMVQSIARLGQHYLTNQSPLLRQKLLDLITTACLSLCIDEDQFLPLVNDIWPTVVKRLFDEEPFVIIAASKAVAAICKCAGDFMATRIQVEWRDLLRLVGQAKLKARAESSGRHGRGVFSLNSQVWESLVVLLTAIIEYVHIDDEMFDEILEILGDLLVSREDVRNALMAINADAVWLRELENGQHTDLKVPVMENVTFASIAYP